MTLSMHYINVHKLLTKEIKEFRYVVKSDERVMIPTSISVKRALDTYKTHKGIRTILEALWRAMALGIRYDPIQENSLMLAVKEVYEMNWWRLTSTDL